MKIYISIVFVLLCSSVFAQIYTLENNERVIDAYILNETNYAFILEKIDINNQKTFDIIYNNTRLSGYKEAGIIRILPNGTLVATMLKASLGKDMWTLIYGDREYEFDSIERSVFSGDNSVIFARLEDYGIAIINGESEIRYLELFDSVINDNGYAFSYNRDGEYFININGEEKTIDGKADRLKFSVDGTSLIYVVNGEDGNIVIVNGQSYTETFASADDFAAFDLNNVAYAIKLMPETNETFLTNENIYDSIITNRESITNYNLSNISVYTNEEGITVKGQSNTIALMIVTNIITEFYLNNPLTNDDFTDEAFVKTSVMVNGRNYGYFDLITNMSFSPNGGTLVFVNINTNGAEQLYMGGVMIADCDKIYGYKYSDDSKSFSYGAESNGISFIVLNGKRLNKDYEGINELYFSTNNNLVYNASKNGREYIIGNDFESPSYNKITSFKFIGDSFAFTGERAGRSYYFILNKENAIRREFGGYDFVSEMNKEQDFAISIVSDGKTAFIIKDGVIIN